MKNEDDLSDIYMELCAALISMTGETEVFIPKSHFPNTEFEIWRRPSDDEEGLIVRVIQSNIAE